MWTTSNIKLMLKIQFAQKYVVHIIVIYQFTMCKMNIMCNLDLSWWAQLYTDSFIIVFICKMQI